MLDTILIIALSILLVASCSGWSWWLVKQSAQMLSQAQAFKVFKQLSDELDARVSTRVKIINKNVIPGDLPLGMGVSVNQGADNLTSEQPPITMSAILDEQHEIQRELLRYKNPNSDFSKRDDFASYEDA